MPLSWSIAAPAAGVSTAGELTARTTPLPRTTSGQIRFESMQYMKEIAESPDLTNSQFLSARLSLLGSMENFPRVSYAGDFSAGTFFRRSQTQFVVHEANVATRLSPASSLTVGRKKSFWSAMDERWQLGMYQPQFAIDALRPEEQGLTGAFLDFKGSNFEFVGFATPIFIPTMGPEIREENGSLVSDSRWYRQPSSAFQVANQNRTILYGIDMPEMSKLVANPGSALMGRWGSREKGAWIGGAWAYKPVNALILKRKNFQQISTGDIDVTMAPDVGYHDLVSMDVGYSVDTVQASVSVLADRPHDKKADDEGAIQRLEPMQAYSAQVDWLIRNFFTKTVQVQVSYLKVYGGGITDVTSNGKPDDFTVFDSRLKFTDAASIGLQGQLLQIDKKPLVTKFRYLYDWAQRGSLMNTEFQLYPERSWAIVMGADILGVDDENDNKSGFLNQFRANDRVYGGMTYVF